VRLRLDTLFAQAKLEGFTLVTVDDVLRAYGVPAIWAC
jgi:PIN domain nuclease of toxin-antitoxin system